MSRAAAVAPSACAAAAHSILPWSNPMQRGVWNVGIRLMQNLAEPGCPRSTCARIAHGGACETQAAAQAHTPLNCWEGQAGTEQRLTSTSRGSNHCSMGMRAGSTTCMHAACGMMVLVLPPVGRHGKHLLDIQQVAHLRLACQGPCSQPLVDAARSYERNAGRWSPAVAQRQAGCCKRATC